MWHWPRSWRNWRTRRRRESRGSRGSRGCTVNGTRHQIARGTRPRVCTCDDPSGCALCDQWRLDKVGPGASSEGGPRSLHGTERETALRMRTYPLECDYNCLVPVQGDRVEALGRHVVVRAREQDPAAFAAVFVLRKDAKLLGRVEHPQHDAEQLHVRTRYSRLQTQRVTGAVRPSRDSSARPATWRGRGARWKRPRLMTSKTSEVD